MPVNAIFLTQEEYDGITSRLTALESALSQSGKESADMQQRVQSVESTVSAFQKTMADLPVKGVK